MSRPTLILLAAIGLIAALTAVAYIPAMVEGGYIWDDDQYVTENMNLRDGEGLRRTWFDRLANPQYYPMVFTTFWIEYQLWDLDPRGYHVTNVVLHALVSILLLLALRRLEIPGAWLAAAIFAVHPVHVESVAWITERKNVLSGIFYLASLLCYLRFAGLPGAVPKRRSMVAYAGAMLLFIAALLSKSVTCSLPAAILLFMWWRKRLHWREVLWLVPFFVIGVVAASNTTWIEQNHVGARFLDFGLNDFDRIVLAGRTSWFYATKLLWPAPLIFFYPRWVIDSGELWQWIFPLGAIALLVTLWALRHRIGRGPLVSVLYFGGTLVPAIGFIDVFPFKYSYVADHFQYLASIGIIVLVSAAIDVGLERLIQRFAHGARGPAFAIRLVPAVPILAVLAVLTWRQCYAYVDAETLWRHTLERNENAAMVYINLGNIESDRGHYYRAIDHYEQALNVDPPERDTFVRARANFNIGNNYYKLGQQHGQPGDYHRALQAYSRALEIEERYTRAHYGRALAYFQLGQQAGIDDEQRRVFYEQSVRAGRQMLFHDPNHARAPGIVSSAQRQLDRLGGG